MRIRVPLNGRRPIPPNHPVAALARVAEEWDIARSRCSSLVRSLIIKLCRSIGVIGKDVHVQTASPTLGPATLSEGQIVKLGRRMPRL
jgi:hypothetical protein